MKNRKPQGAFYERAPNILTEKIAELSSLLTNYRNKGHSADVLKFYEEVLDAMKLAHLYMQQSIRVEKHIILFLSEKKNGFPYASISYPMPDLKVQAL